MRVMFLCYRAMIRLVAHGRVAYVEATIVVLIVSSFQSHSSARILRGISHQFPVSTQ